MAMHVSTTIFCESLERHSHEVAEFAAAAKARLGKNSWTVIEPCLHSIWRELPWGTEGRSWWEIREFVREIWLTT